MSRRTALQLNHSSRFQIAKDRMSRLEVDIVPNAKSDLADNSTNTPSVSWASTCRCTTCPPGCTFIDLGQRLSTLGITDLVHWSIVGINQQTPSHDLLRMLLVICRSSIASIAATLPSVSVAPQSSKTLPRVRFLTTKSLSRYTVTFQLGGTQTPRCEIHGMCHVTSVLLIPWTLTYQIHDREIRISSTVLLIGVIGL